jgi:aryl-alcohol dehydrogenase-like predicted oxidoreductase
MGTVSRRKHYSIPGTKRRKYLQENADAIDIELTPADEKAIEEILAKYPNTGERYHEEAAKMVNK